MVVVEYTYDAWGKPMGITGSMSGTLGQDNPFRYRGYYYDTETQLYYLNSRYYNPEWGRYINADTFAGSMGNLLTHNLFIYCVNNPVNAVDPSGHCFMFLLGAIGAIAGGIIGGVVAACNGGDLGDIVAGAAVGAATGGLIGLTCGAAASVAATAGTITGATIFAETTTVAAAYGFGTAVTALSSWTSAMATASGALWRTFEKWYYNYNGISEGFQQFTKGNCKFDAINSALSSIVELKCYDWSRYTYLNGVINNFLSQGSKYLQYIGTSIGGVNIKNVMFYFSSKPPQAVIDALRSRGFLVDWVK